MQRGSLLRIALAACAAAALSCSGGGDPASGPDAGGDPGGCTPVTTCATAWCGPHPDGCGGTLECVATCSGASVCGGVTPGFCAACTANGVCAERPDLFRGGYKDAFGTSANDVWVLDTDDPIFEWNGTGWRDRSCAVPITPDGTFTYGPDRLWGTSPTSMWGISTWGIFRWNGTAWSFVEGRFRPLYGIWGTSDSDVWVVGGNGTIAHFDGTSWSQTPSGTAEILLDVWATAPGDAWAVGQNGVLLRWNGTSWARPYQVTTTVDFRAIHPIGADQALVILDTGEIARWDGAQIVSWAPGQIGFVRDLWAFGANDVWRAAEYGSLQHWNGTEWTTRDTGTDATLEAVWGAPNGDVWVAATNSTVLRVRAAP